MMLFSLAETTKELQQQVNTLQKELLLPKFAIFSQLLSFLYCVCLAKVHATSAIVGANADPNHPDSRLKWRTDTVPIGTNSTTVR